MQNKVGQVYAKSELIFEDKENSLLNYARTVQIR